ncbi:unnamed protein product [Chrysoparadoxa australica]
MASTTIHEEGYFFVPVPEGMTQNRGHVSNIEPRQHQHQQQQQQQQQQPPQLPQEVGGTEAHQGSFPRSGSTAELCALGVLDNETGDCATTAENTEYGGSDRSLFDAARANASSVSLSGMVKSQSVSSLRSLEGGSLFVEDKVQGGGMSTPAAAEKVQYASMQQQWSGSAGSAAGSGSTGSSAVGLPMRSRGSHPSHLQGLAAAEGEEVQRGAHPQARMKHSQSYGSSMGSLRGYHHTAPWIGAEREGSSSSVRAVAAGAHYASASASASASAGTKSGPAFRVQRPLVHNVSDTDLVASFDRLSHTKKAHRRLSPAGCSPLKGSIVGVPIDDMAIDPNYQWEPLNDTGDTRDGRRSPGPMMPRHASFPTLPSGTHKGDEGASADEVAISSCYGHVPQHRSRSGSYSQAQHPSPTREGTRPVASKADTAGGGSPFSSAHKHNRSPARAHLPTQHEHGPPAGARHHVAPQLQHEVQQQQQQQQQGTQATPAQQRPHLPSQLAHEHRQAQAQSMAAAHGMATAHSINQQGMAGMAGMAAMGGNMGDMGMVPDPWALYNALLVNQSMAAAAGMRLPVMLPNGMGGMNMVNMATLAAAAEAQAQQAGGRAPYGAGYNGYNEDMHLAGGYVHGGMPGDLRGMRANNMGMGGGLAFDPSQQPHQPQDLGDGNLYTVQFKKGSRDFLLGKTCPRDLEIGDYVKVEADRGEDMGRITAIHPIPESSMTRPATAGHKHLSYGQYEKERILHLAGEEEALMLQEKIGDEERVLEVCRAKVRQRGLPMEVIDAEFQYDRHKLTFFFHAEGRVDFRELVRDLFALYKTRIWMQQVEPSHLQASARSYDGSSHISSLGMQPPGMVDMGGAGQSYHVQQQVIKVSPLASITPRAFASINPHAFSACGIFLRYHPS